MSRRTVIPGARSYRNGQLTRPELIAMAMQFSDERVRTAVLEEVNELEDYAIDALLVEGDLTIDGDLDTGDTGDTEGGDTEGTLLVVRGDLPVRGLYRDSCNDAPDRVLVLGDLRAENLITAAELEVRGSIVVPGSIVGDYNDGVASVGGELCARLFVPGDHAFRVRGAIRADYFVPGSNTIEAMTKPQPAAWREVPLASSSWSGEVLDVSTLVQRLKARAPVLH